MSDAYEIEIGDLKEQLENVEAELEEVTGVKAKLNKERLEAFETASEPLIKHLCETKWYHPHFRVLVDSVSAEAVEGSHRYNNSAHIKD